jgi:hypothetical protein
MAGGVQVSGAVFAVLIPAIVTALAGLAVAVLVVVLLVKHGAEMTCPVCAERVDRGAGNCSRCGFDFAAGADPID